MIIGVDFDGTIVSENFPNIGVELPGAIDTLKLLRKRGHKVFLYTMRGHSKDRDTLQEAVDWLWNRGLELDGINRSPSQFSPSPKQFAHLYFDDRQFNAPTRIWKGMEVYDWKQVADWLLDNEFISDMDYIGLLKNF